MKMVTFYVQHNSFCDKVKSFKLKKQINIELGEWI